MNKCDDENKSGFVEGPLFLSVVGGVPYLALEVSVGNFWEMGHFPGRDGRPPWVLLHWVPADAADPSEDNHTCDDVQEFDSFGEGLAAFCVSMKGGKEAKPRSEGGKKGNPRDILIGLSNREFHTVLAALRFWQQEKAVGKLPLELREIANNHGGTGPLSHNEIDALCERINCGD